MQTTPLRSPIAKPQNGPLSRPRVEPREVARMLKHGRTLDGARIPHSAPVAAPETLSIWLTSVYWGIPYYSQYMTLNWQSAPAGEWDYVALYDHEPQSAYDYMTNQWQWIDGSSQGAYSTHTVDTSFPYWMAYVIWNASLNEYQVVQTAGPFLQQPRWMTNMSDQLGAMQVNRIILPGTHDSGTYSITSQSMLSPDLAPEWAAVAAKVASILGIPVDTIISNWARAQGKTVLQQLQAGVRYLDLRVALDTNNNTLYVVHGMYGTTIQDVINQIGAFVTANPQELLILDFQHFFQMTPASHTALLGMLRAAFGNRMVRNTLNPSNTLDDVWNSNASVIIIYSDDTVSSANSDVWANSRMFRDWPNAQDTETMLTDITNGLAKRASGTGANTLFVSQGILTPDGNAITKWMLTDGIFSLERLADDVSPVAANWLSQNVSTGQLNTLIVDWFESCNMVNLAIQGNRQLATQVRLPSGNGLAPTIAAPTKKTA